MGLLAHDSVVDGAYLELSLHGSSISPDHSSNQVLYGDLSADEVRQSLHCHCMISVATLCLVATVFGKILQRSSRPYCAQLQLPAWAHRCDPPYSPPRCVSRGSGCCPDVFPINLDLHMPFKLVGCWLVSGCARLQRAAHLLLIPCSFAHRPCSSTGWHKTHVLCPVTCVVSAGAGRHGRAARV